MLPERVLGNVWELVGRSYVANDTRNFIKTILDESNLKYNSLSDDKTQFFMLSRSLGHHQISTKLGGKVNFSLKMEGNFINIDIIDAIDLDYNSVPFSVADANEYKFKDTRYFESAQKSLRRLGLTLEQDNVGNTIFVRVTDTAQ